MKIEFCRKKYKGKLIVFTGMDGCGKTTQVELIKNRLIKNGYKVFATKQPTDNVRKSELYKVFVNSSDHKNYDYRSFIFLTISDRLQHSNIVIREKLEKGYIVLMDRYFYTSVANLRARGYRNDKWIYEVSKYLPKPDLIIYLKIDTKTSIKRVIKRKKTGNDFIDGNFQKKLNKEYELLSRKNGFEIINSNLGINQISDNIWGIIKRIL